MESERRYFFQRNLSQVFTPSSPIRDYDVFAGRMDQIMEVLSAINQPGMHAIIYGERGVGKTSLANILPTAYHRRDVPLPITKVIADSSDTFQSIWTKVFEKTVVPPDLAPDSLIDEADEDGELFLLSENPKKGMTYSGMLPQKAGPNDVVTILEMFPEFAVIIVDEFDRIQHPKTTSAFADLIKQMSDSELSVTLILIGVADSISELIQEHASIERCTKQIYLPRMEQGELETFVEQGFAKVGMTLDGKVPEKIAKLAQGFPHYAHSLCLSAGNEALKEERESVEVQDVKRAVTSALKNVQSSIHDDYIKAIDSSRKENLFERVIVACSIAKQNELGYFGPADVKVALEDLLGEPVDYPIFTGHLAKFCEPDRASILQKGGAPRRWKFRFKNPLMCPYVYMRGVEKGLVPANYSPF